MADPESGVRWADISDSDESSDEETPTQQVERRTPVAPVSVRPKPEMNRPGAMDYNSMERGGNMNRGGYQRDGGFQRDGGYQRDYKRVQGIGHNRRGGLGQNRGMGGERDYHHDKDVWKRQSKDSNFQSAHSSRPTSNDLKSSAMSNNNDKLVQVTQETIGFAVEGFNMNPTEELIRGLHPMFNEQDTVRVEDGRGFIKLSNKMNCIKFWDDRPTHYGNHNISWTPLKDMPNSFFVFERGTKRNEKTAQSVAPTRHTTIASRKPDNRAYAPTTSGVPKRNNNHTMTGGGPISNGPSGIMSNSAGGSESQHQQSSMGFNRNNFGTKLTTKPTPVTVGGSDFIPNHNKSNNTGVSLPSDDNAGAKVPNSPQVVSESNTQRARTGSGNMRGGRGAVTGAYGKQSNSKNANNSMANGRGDNKSVNNRGGSSRGGRGGSGGLNNNNGGASGGFNRVSTRNSNYNNKNSSPGGIQGGPHTATPLKTSEQQHPVKDEPVKEKANTNRYAALCFDESDDDHSR